jgi:hypothetical protein
MCLQFTLVHAASCVLHRTTSRVIHRLELCLWTLTYTRPGGLTEANTLHELKVSSGDHPDAEAASIGLSYGSRSGCRLYRPGKLPVDGDQSYLAIRLEWFFELSNQLEAMPSWLVR